MSRDPMLHDQLLHDPMMDRGIQSSLPSLVGEGFYSRPGPDHNPDYVEDSDLENMVQEIQQGRSPDSSVGEPDLGTVTGKIFEILKLCSGTYYCC